MSATRQREARERTKGIGRRGGRAGRREGRNLILLRICYGRYDCLLVATGQGRRCTLCERSKLGLTRCTQNGKTRRDEAWQIYQRLRRRHLYTSPSLSLSFFSVPPVECNCVKNNNATSSDERRRRDGAAMRLVNRLLARREIRFRSVKRLLSRLSISPARWKGAGGFNDAIYILFTRAYCVLSRVSSRHRTERNVIDRDRW